MIHSGDTFPTHEFETMRDETVTVPDGERLTHLQLRRFAGCPVCNLHLHSVIQRKDEIAGAGIHEVIVFHSSKEDLLKHQDELPFDVVPDPDKRIYRELGVESSIRAVLGPRAARAIAAGLARSVAAAARGRKPPPPLKPEGGSLGLPADFLIGRDGRVIAAKYGEHAFDQWSVDELLEKARSAAA